MDIYPAVNEVPGAPCQSDGDHESAGNSISPPSMKIYQCYAEKMKDELAALVAAESGFYEAGSEGRAHKIGSALDFEIDVVQRLRRKRSRHTTVNDFFS